MIKTKYSCKRCGKMMFSSFRGRHLIRRHPELGLVDYLALDGEALRKWQSEGGGAILDRAIEENFEPAGEEMVSYHGKW